MTPSATPPTPPEPVAPQWLVPTLALAAFVNMTGGIALVPFLPVVADELGTSVALLGQVPSLMMLVAALLGLVAGPLADQYGYRRMLVAGLLTVVVSAVATGLAPTFPILLFVTLVGAVGRAAVMPIAQAVVATEYPDDDRRRRALSWVHTGHNSAALLGIPLLTTIAAFFDWRGSVFVLGGLALGLTLLLWRQLAADGAPAGPAPRLQSVLAAYAPLRQHPPTLALAGQSFVGTIGTYAAYSYLGAYFVQRHGATTQEVGWSYLAVGAGVVLGTQLIGSRLGARLRPLLVVTRVAGGLLIGAALILPLPMLVVVGLVTLGTMAHTANQVATAVLLVGESPAGQATTITLNNSALSLGIAVGGSVGGLALAVGDYLAVGLVSLAALLAAAGLIWRSRPREVPPLVPAGL